MLFGPWNSRGLTCPAGHSRAFTQYGLAIYSCHDCSPVGEHKFVQRLGVSTWTDPDKVPPGLLEMSKKVSTK